MEHTIELITIAIGFYIIDLIWKSSSLYNKITSKKFFHKKLNKLILLLISIVLIFICIIVEDKLSGYLIANDSFELTMKGIPLVILYIITSFIFTNKIDNKKSSSI